MVIISKGKNGNSTSGFAHIFPRSFIKEEEITIARKTADNICRISMEFEGTLKYHWHIEENRITKRTPSSGRSCHTIFTIFYESLATR